MVELHYGTLPMRRFTHSTAKGSLVSRLQTSNFGLKEELVKDEAQDVGAAVLSVS